MEQRRLSLKQHRNLVCNQIEIETQGNDFYYQKENIKEEQCSKCKYKNNIKKCRLVIEDMKCKNFMAK